MVDRLCHLGETIPHKACPRASSLPQEKQERSGLLSCNDDATVAYAIEMMQYTLLVVIGVGRDEGEVRGQVQ
jgi:hypothetical protein